MKVGTPALVIYLMAGDDLPELAAAALRGGATAIEYGRTRCDEMSYPTAVKSTTRMARPSAS